MSTPLPLDPDHAVTWARLVPLMSGGRPMRLSRDGGRSYPRRYQRTVTTTAPNQPAAIVIYDNDGCAPLICLDLDASRGDVDADHRALTRLLDRSGLRWFSDHSPNGGRHIYVPLAQPVPFPEASAVVRALTASTPTLDPLPMLGLQQGCIRPPGARHRTGGHQILDGPLQDAEAVLRSPNPASAWERLTAIVLAQPITRPTPATVAPTEQLDPLAGFTEPDPSFQQIARTGSYNSGRYATPSEARQAVVWAAVACGWSFTDLTRRLEDGTWRGLASFYARYPTSQRHQAVSRDWRQAITFEKHRRERAGNSHVRVCTTSASKTHRADTNPPPPNDSARQIRIWLTAVDLLSSPDTDLAERAVLYALGEAAALTGSLVIEHGSRSLAIATGLDRSTVSRALQRLRDAPPDRALIDQIRSARGIRADTYQLIVPALLQPACERATHRRGSVHAIRPAFRELGLTAAFVYAALERAAGPLSGRELAPQARCSITATYDVLTVLASWGLAQRSPTGGWILGTTRPAQLAETWGIVDEVRDQIQRYRAERRIWHLWLRDHGLLPLDIEPTNTDPPPQPPWPPPQPPDNDEGLLALLGRVLGAEAIA